MSGLTDEELIDELKKRFTHTKQTLYDLKMLTKKLEEVNKKLEESERVKSTFVSHMKNEINNPLTSILGLSHQLIKSEGSDHQLVVAMANMIHSEAFSLDFQLRNIFAAAEIESGEAAVHVTRLDVETLIQDAIDSFRHLSDEKSITIVYGRLEVNQGEERLLFKSDAEKLALIFTNLLSNAIEFNHHGGSITINAGVVDNNLSISVGDTGVGLDPDHIKIIFDRFTQLESGSRKQHKGHGLGLSITKAIIDMLEGDISVSCTIDKGCTFTVSLPQVETDIDADAFSVDGNEFFFGDDQIEAF